MGSKANMYKRPLVHKRIEPVSLVDIVPNDTCFQGYEVRKLSDMTFPFILEKEAVIIDFGSHYTGYLHIDSILLSFFDGEKELFVTAKGEISWHSQAWAALSGALSQAQAQALLKKTAQVNPEIRFSSPFMMHYYLEALYVNGMPEQALACIKDFWGGILNAGFDCCPECFQFGNEWLSPYAHPAMNSACHAWSCTPSYWIRRFYQ